MKINYLLNFDHIIFDCDGVLIDSNSIKTIAFKKLFVDHNKKDINKLITYHLENNGKSRYDKIKYFYNEILHKEISNIEINAYAKKYSELSLSKILKKKLNPYVLKILKILKNENKNLYVISGADEKDLKLKLKKKKIFNYFTKVKGSPNTKNNNFFEINEKNLDINKFIYVGDSKYDYEFTKKIGISFVYMQEYSTWKISNKNLLNLNIFKVRNFKDFIN